MRTHWPKRFEPGPGLDTRVVSNHSTTELLSRDSFTKPLPSHNYQKSISSQRKSGMAGELSLSDHLTLSDHLPLSGDTSCLNSGPFLYRREISVKHTWTGARHTAIQIVAIQPITLKTTKVVPHKFYISSI